MVDYSDFMLEAIKLAENGRGKVSPNPLVGALVVKDGNIISDGYHQYFGGDHAEVEAIKKAGEMAKGATLICTLEPCSHYGKTPPCVESIISSGISRVVMGLKDPNPLVSGKGIKKLKDAGVDVVCGIEEEKVKVQNESYIKFIKTKIPFVTLKTAVSNDGKISETKSEKIKITGPRADEYVHRLRSYSDAVITGIGTVKIDDPLLNVRQVENGKNPVRVIVDSNANISHDTQIVKTADTIRTIVAVTKEAKDSTLDKLKSKGVDILLCGESENRVDLFDLLAKLGKMNIAGVMVEAGSRLNRSFLDSGLVDKFIILQSNDNLGIDGIDAFDGIPWQDFYLKYVKNNIVRQKRLGDDTLLEVVSHVYRHSKNNRKS